MLGENDRTALKKGLRTLWIIWAAIAGSLLIYVFICHQFGEEIRRTVRPDSSLVQIKNILYGVVVVTLFLTHFLRRLMLKGRFRGAEARRLTPTLSPSQPPFLVKYITVVVVSLALSESIGIYGLILFFLGDNFQTLYIFISISALALFYYRPRIEELEQLALVMQYNS